MSPASPGGRAYAAQLTGEVAIGLYLAVLGALALIVLGATRLPGGAAGYPLIGLGVAILAASAGFVFIQHHQTITIRADGIEYVSRFGRIELAWQEVTVFEKRPRGLLLRPRARVGTARQRFVVDSGFFPDYDQIVSLIGIATRRHRHTWLLVERAERPADDRERG